MNYVIAFEGYVKPPNWTKEIWELDTDPNNNGFKNEDFIVWMRTAALPNFRKLYRRVDHNIAPFQDGLPKGEYFLYVKYCEYLGVDKFMIVPFIKSGCIVDKGNFGL